MMMIRVFYCIVILVLVIGRSVILCRVDVVEMSCNSDKFEDGVEVCCGVMRRWSICRRVGIFFFCRKMVGILEKFREVRRVVMIGCLIIRRCGIGCFD